MIHDWCCHLRSGVWMSDCTMTDMKHVFPRLTRPLSPMVLAAALGRVGDSEDRPFLLLCFFSSATSSCVQSE